MIRPGTDYIAVTIIRFFKQKLKILKIIIILDLV